VFDYEVVTLDVTEVTQPLTKGLLEVRGRVGRQVAYSKDLGRLLGLGGERRGEKGEGQDSCERGAYDHHAATAPCWLIIAASFRQPSILCNLIWPLARRLNSRTTAASPLGSEPRVFTRRRNSSWSRSITWRR